MTISSVLAMVAFADSGIGTGVLNAVVKAFGKDEREGCIEQLCSSERRYTGVACFLPCHLSICQLGDLSRVVSSQASPFGQY